MSPGSDSQALPEADELVSSKEVAEMLGVKHTTVHRYRQREELPEPYVVLACGPIWLRSQIDHWNRFERPRSTGSLTPE